LKRGALKRNSGEGRIPTRIVFDLHPAERIMSKQLAADYFFRAKGRRQVVTLLISQGMHADAVRESQELVELLKEFEDDASTH
jgi:hypothetical protein